VIREDGRGQRVEAALSTPSRPGEPLGSSGPNAARWERYRARFAPVASTSLGELRFPARVYTFAQPRKIETLGELLDVAWDDFSNARNVGRCTVAATLGVLDAAADRLGVAAPDTSRHVALTREARPPSLEPRIERGARWLTLLRDALDQLDTKERIILTKRSGLAGTIPTLQEIADSFGRSLEPIRQIAARGIRRLRRRLPRIAATRRLSCACAQIVTEPEVVAAADALFAFEEEEVPALMFFVNELLAGAVRALLLNERLVYSRVERAVLCSRLRHARTVVEAAALPIEEERLAHSIASALDIGVSDAAALFDCLDEPVHRNGPLIVGFGGTRDEAILVTLRVARGPVRRSSLEAEHGRGRLPRQAILVDRGLVSLPEKVPGWEGWARRLPPIVRTLIEREGPERQWSAFDLVELLATECDLPEWMNAYALASILRASSERVYLGRNVFACAAVSRKESSDS